MQLKYHMVTIEDLAPENHGPFDNYEEEDTMTGEEIYNALQDYLKTQTVPAASWAEFQEAVRMGITDGTNPCQLVPRWQAALMTKRAAKKVKS